MLNKCPGSLGFSQPHPEYIKCPFCSYEIEIFSDEASAVCAKCKKTVFRQTDQTCLDWCRYAKQCVGEKAYEKYLKRNTSGGKEEKKKGDRDAK